MPTRPQPHDRNRTEPARTNEPNRLSPARRGYGRRWQKARSWYLKYHPLCVQCGYPADVVDHVEPHKGDYDLFWNTANWQALCASCHSRKTAREDGGFGNKIKK